MTTQNYIWRAVFASALAFVLAALNASAHGGVQKQAGDVAVYLTQSPLSPLVGEKVSFTFVLKKGVNSPLASVPVAIDIVETFYGDATKDVILWTDQYITDANGAFSFTYTFHKENYFDIDLTFTDPTSGTSEQTGFLVQTRLEASQDSGWPAASRLLLSGLCGAVVAIGAYGLARWYTVRYGRRKNS